MITATQMRGARAMTGMSIEQLAAASGLPAATIETMERDERDGEPHALLAVRQALEAAGIIFIASGNHDEGGPGVRLRARTGVDEGIRPENLNAANDD
ncbi:helix-turn-helix domain-containing protein [Rhizobium sp. 3T7]|uniref:helix-turn-helix transcriptional regulator n=1 Tax=Rhizobium sp. 3T7 TaxID=2874922 RepID=UPI001CCDBED0|nr:helix-turn-helix transcriptional regulator [Rhizobium sp. 3T7]MBZ9790290.1 helix-turn-helix domain-containing protein [Rhizobium sp. 3T7]